MVVEDGEDGGGQSGSAASPSRTAFGFIWSFDPSQTP